MMRKTLINLTILIVVPALLDGVVYPAIEKASDLYEQRKTAKSSPVQPSVIIFNGGK